MRFRIGRREVGDGAPCFIVFEAGATHDGLACALELAQRAAEAGADAIKFQMLDPDRLVADRQQLFAYEVLVDRASGKTETIQEPLYDLLRRRSMPRADWEKLKRHCDRLGLAFFATVGFPDEIDFLASIGCDSVKIASADINHFPLITHAARTGMSLQIDTGNATLGEVETAVDIIMRAGNEKVVIHHCPTGYPARLDKINLRILTTLKAMFPLPVAFSDHSPGWEMDIAAIALGANMVEKTITLDRTTRSIEHMFSLEPPQMRRFVQVVRDLEKALGAPRKQLTAEDIAARTKIRRSAYLRCAVSAGEQLVNDLVEFRRPGYGIGPHEIDLYLGLAFNRDMQAGEMLRPGDLHRRP